MRVRRTDFCDGRNYAIAVASEALAPALRLGARALVPRAPAAPGAWRTGLILGNGHIGDVLYRTCSLEHLAAQLAGCRWSYLTTPFAAPVLLSNPALHEVLPLQQSASPASIEPRAVSELRARRFDAVLCSESVRHHEALLLALRLGIPNRAAFTHRGLSGLTTHGVPLPAAIPRPAQFRRMVETITGVPDPSPLRPRVHYTPGDARAAAGEWFRLGLDGARVVIASAVTTRQRAAALPPAFFRDILARALSLAPDARILLIGSADDAATLQALAAELGERAVVSAGHLPIRAIVPLLARALAFLGNDSAPRHLANAAGIPVMFVRNMCGSAAETGRYCPTEVDVAPPGEYLSPTAMERALDRVDRAAVASALAERALRRASGTPAGTRP